jgi:hypothetical protein
MCQQVELEIEKELVSAFVAGRFVNLLVCLCQNKLFNINSKHLPLSRLWEKMIYLYMGFRSIRIKTEISLAHCFTALFYARSVIDVGHGWIKTTSRSLWKR